MAASIRAIITRQPALVLGRMLVMRQYHLAIRTVGRAQPISQ